MAAAWIGEGLYVGVRWLHALATVAWLGGSLFYLVVLRPAVRTAGASPQLEQAIATGFRDVVEASLITLLITGVLLTFERLSSGAASGLYLAVLAVKIALALVMFWLAWELGWAGRRRAAGRVRGRDQRRGRLGRWLAPSHLVLTLGVVVVLLAAVLRQIFEAGLGTSAGAGA